VAGHCEDGRLLSHEVALLERLREVQLSAQPLRVHGLLLGLRVLGAVAHTDQLFKGAFEVGDLQVLVLLRRKGVFNVGVAAGVANPDGEGEVLAVQVLLHLLQEHLQLLEVVGFVDLAQRLVELQFLVGSQQIALDSVDFGLSVGRNLKVDFLEVDD
jgi:hypothetical protein